MDPLQSKQQLEQFTVPPARDAPAGLDRLPACTLQLLDEACQADTGYPRRMAKQIEGGIQWTALRWAIDGIMGRES